jgi:O-antigen/teichoic acid export membrane protein
LAFNVSSWVPGFTTTAVRWVSIAGFSRLAEQTPESLSLGVRRSLPLLFAAVLPATVLMSLLAPSLIVFLYGPSWAPAGDVLRFLAISMVARVLTNLAFDILTSLGATRSIMFQYLGWAVVLIPALLIGANADGIRGAAIAHALVDILIAVPLALWALHRGGVRLRPAMPELVRPLVGGAVTAGVVLLVAGLVPTPPVVQLLLAGGGGLIVYVLIVVPREQLKQLRARFAPVR